MQPQLPPTPRASTARGWSSAPFKQTPPPCSRWPLPLSVCLWDCSVTDLLNVEARSPSLAAEWASEPHCVDGPQAPVRGHVLALVSIAAANTSVQACPRFPFFGVYTRNYVQACPRSPFFGVYTRKWNCWTCETESISRSVVSHSLRPQGLQPTRLLLPGESWGSPGKNTRVGCHPLFWGIFPTQCRVSCTVGRSLTV